MKELENEIIDAFRLITVNGLVSLANDCARNHVPQYLGFEFEGFLPSQDTEAQRESTNDNIWPPKNIWHLIERVGEKMWLEYLDKAVPAYRQQLPKQVFILLTTALDLFLERRGFNDTLGRKYRNIAKQIIIPAQLNADIQEFIQRRNDVAHKGGKVSDKYVQASSFSQLHNSSWVKQHGTPAQGLEHDFGLQYLFWATSVIYEFAKIVP